MALIHEVSMSLCSSTDNEITLTLPIGMGEGVLGRRALNIVLCFLTLVRSREG